VALYRPALITYLDIMRFKELIDESKLNPAKTDEILQVLRTMKTKLHLGVNPFATPPQKEEKDSFHTVNFSDLTVRATYLDSHLDLFESVEYELMDLAIKQTELVCNGILLRGAITVGDIFIDGHHIFGPGLVDGYLLERDLAVFPRIIIHDELLKKLGGIKEEMPGSWKIGDDGIWFVDYLFGYFLRSMQYPKNTTFSCKQVLLKHKETAEQNLIQVAGKGPRIRQKAIWMALYHNGVTNRIRTLIDIKPRDQRKQIQYAEASDALKGAAIEPHLLYE
jgi:hypothetical protein